MFQNLLAKTLYITKLVRPDNCTAVAFPTIRVRQPNKDDSGKIVHLMKYIMGTRDFTFILSTNGSGVLKWWIDAYYSVHPNMWVHTGRGFSMRRVFPILTSTKQKLNTRSLTESEIVGVHECMPDV